VTCIAVSADSSTLACGTSDGSLLLWNISTGALQSTLDKHPSQIVTVTFSSNDQLWSGSRDGVVRLWTKNLSQGHFQEHHIGQTCSFMAFSHVDDSLAIVNENGSTLCLLKRTETDAVYNPKERAALPPAVNHISGSTILAIRFSPDGKQVTSTGYDQQALIWNSNSGELLGSHKHDTWGLCLAFSPDSTLLLWGLQNGTAIMY
ncbi:WD40 repeat-like protein, partial [Dentipellis sp. KUC8613]